MGTVESKNLPVDVWQQLEPSNESARTSEMLWGVKKVEWLRAVFYQSDIYRA
jgi:hypothetical protein